MTTTVSNTFEGGSDETLLTAVNSGGASGIAFTSTFYGGASTLKFDTAKSARGSYSLRLDNSNSAAIASWGSAAIGSGHTETWGRLYIWLNNWDPQRFTQFDNSGSRASALDVLGSGKLRLWDNSTTLDSSGTVPTGEWVRIEWHVVHSTTAGLVEAKIFRNHSTTPIETVSTTADKNTLASMNTMVIGQYISQATTFSTWYDDVAFSTIGWIGPSPSIPFQWLEGTQGLRGRGIGW